MISLFNEPKVNNLTTFCDVAKNLTSSELASRYNETLNNPPSRHLENKRYFIETHNGIPSSNKESNRREEHLALALYHTSKSSDGLSLPSSKTLEIIDYQTPLKASNQDKGIGKIDLLGITNKSSFKSSLSIIELKIHGKNNNLADTPLRALLEGLAYCAIVEDNIVDIKEELLERFDIKLSDAPLSLIIMATSEYWEGYLTHQKVGKWLPELNRIIRDVKETLNINVSMIGIKNADFTMGLDGQKPELTGDYKFVSVEC